MSATELKSIIAKISCIQQFDKKKMIVTGTKTLKQIKRLQKEEK